MKKLLLALSLLLPPPNAYADPVISVTDGDTLTVLHAGQPLRIRIANIDAPEQSQVAGETAKRSLTALCHGKNARYTRTGTDKYGRTIATVSCDGVDAGKEQVTRGLAWVYRQYNTDASLPALEIDARKSKRGLWVIPTPEAPWDYRGNAWTKANTPPPKQNPGSESDPGPKKRKHKPCLVGSRGGRFHLSDSGSRVYGCGK